MKGVKETMREHKAVSGDLESLQFLSLPHGSGEIAGSQPAMQIQQLYWLGGRP